MPLDIYCLHKLTLCTVIALLNSSHICCSTFNLHFVTCSAIVN
ncbi:Uncharacterised protein [Enterobacter kobei]|jgi:hypothetical protein|nr:Uncharacterised protein [Enterobacter kobei]